MSCVFNYELVDNILWWSSSIVLTILNVDFIEMTREIENIITTSSAQSTSIINVTTKTMSHTCIRMKDVWHWKILIYKKKKNIHIETVLQLYFVTCWDKESSKFSPTYTTWMIFLTAVPSDDNSFTTEIVNLVLLFSRHCDLVVRRASTLSMHHDQISLKSNKENCQIINEANKFHCRGNNYSY